MRLKDFIPSVFYRWLFITGLCFNTFLLQAAQIDSVLFKAVVSEFYNITNKQGDELAFPSDTVKKFIVSVNGQQVQTVSVLYDQTRVFYEDINSAFNGTIGFYSVIIENYIFGSLQLNPTYADISFSGKVLVQVEEELQQTTSVKANDYFSLQLSQTESLIANTLSAITQYLSEDPGMAMVFNYYLAGYTTDQDKNLIPFEYLHTDYSDLESFLKENFDSPAEISFQEEFKKRAGIFRESLAGDYYDAQRKDIVLQKQAEVSFACVIGVLHQNELLGKVSYLDEFGTCDLEPLHLNAGSILKSHLEEICSEVSLYTNENKSILSATFTSSSGAETDLTVELTGLMTKNELFDLLLDWGVRNESDYCFYRFGDYHDVSTYALWIDTYVLPETPVLAALLADVLMGPAGAVYGYVTGEHWRTGEELTGWDHVLNTFDFIPAALSAGDALKLGISSMKCRHAGKALDMLELAERIPAQAFQFVRNLSSYGLRIAGEEIENIWIIIKSTGTKIGRFADGALADLKLISNYQAEIADIGKVPVHYTGQIVETELKLVSNGDEIGFAIEVLEDVIRGVTRSEFMASVGEFANNPQLGEQAFLLWKNEQWIELEELINLHGINGGWPPMGGFEWIEKFTMEVGETFDRYGGGINEAGLFVDKGIYASPVNTPYPDRALKPGSDSNPPRKYKIIKPIPNVKKGVAIPWFGEPGKGIQYQLPLSIDNLIKEGYIEFFK